MGNGVRTWFLPDLFIDTIYDIDIEKLKEIGIRAFVFDIDNTLAAYSSPVADKPLADWISKLKGQGFKILLASNNGRKRVKQFANSIDCCYVSRACKPLGFIINRELRKIGVKKNNAVLVGDQLFTDVLCAKRMGMYSILVKAISDKEGWFVRFKRNIERKIL